jgi:FGGY-family pentulose kinase
VRTRKLKNKTGPYLLAVDFGTESVRGALVDPKGRIVCSEAKPYPTYFSHAGWAEQKPSEWWSSFVSVVRTILDRSGVDNNMIPSMAVDTTCCTVLALDDGFTPLRDALLWMDVRAYSQAERIADSGMEPLKFNGYGSVSAEWMAPKALWIKEQEPEIYRESRHVCEFQDWINFRLTGRFVGSIANVAARWYYDSKNGGWPVEFYETVGLGDLIKRFPPEILRLGDPVGTITPEIAGETGLSTNTVVVQGGADALVAVLGLNAIKPGRLAFITGSSHLLLGHTDRELHHRGIFGAYPDAVMPGLYLLEGSQISTGSILNWFKEGFISRKHEEEAERRGLSLYDYMNSLAKKIPPGSEGLILLNYWQGNRNPVTDAQARGAVWGLSLNHTTAHVYRAIMEGICYGTEHIMRHFKEAGYIPDEIYACGGATGSDLWMHIQSDVLGLPILTLHEPNAPLLGDAILASFGCGIHTSIEEAAGSMVRIKKRYEPDINRTGLYRYYVDRYIDTYRQLKEIMHDMSEHERSTK